MEVLIATTTGKILNVQRNGFTWGLMEDHDLYTEHLRDPEQWHGRLCLVRVPDMPAADAERFVGGAVPLDWIASHGPTETLEAWQWDLIAEVNDGD